MYKDIKLERNTIPIKCIECSFISVIILSGSEEYNKIRMSRWMGGELIQKVFPELTASERELMISGICPICWNRIYPEEEYFDWE